MRVQLRWLHSDRAELTRACRVGVLVTQSPASTPPLLEGRRRKLLGEAATMLLVAKRPPDDTLKNEV